MGSYTSQRKGIGSLLREAHSLYKGRANSAQDHVNRVWTRVQNLEEHLKKQYGFALRNRDILDIGAGQFLIQMQYFAQCNRVSGIDFDVIPQGIDPVQYCRMFLHNGPVRTLKTISRKLSGIDRRYSDEMKKLLNRQRLPKLAIARMDACNMSHENASFDFVHSYSVFHHLSDPAKALEGIARILRKSGMAYISLHLYTSENGCLDPRVMSAGRGNLPPWPHLRDQYATAIEPNAFLNKLRLAEWLKLFGAWMPGAEIVLNLTSRPGVKSDAEELLRGGEVKGYTLDELITHEVIVFWKKP
jgi:SAM-dependent methyltransferase